MPRTARIEPDTVVEVGGPDDAASTRAHVVVVLSSTTHPDDLPLTASTCLADEIVWKAVLRPALVDEIWQRHHP